VIHQGLFVRVSDQGCPGQLAERDTDSHVPCPGDHKRTTWPARTCCPRDNRAADL